MRCFIQTCAIVERIAGTIIKGYERTQYDFFVLLKNGWRSRKKSRASQTSTFNNKS